MSSSSPIRPASTAAVLPPSGNGQFRETAQWSHTLTENPTQPAYIVNATLEPPVKWRVCTKTEAIYYQETGYKIWRTVDGRKVIFRRREQDPNAAFASQFEEVVDAEQDLEDIGVETTKDEGLMEGADNDDSDEVFGTSFEKASDVSNNLNDSSAAALPSIGDSTTAGSPKTAHRSGGGVAGASSASKKIE